MKTKAAIVSVLMIAVTLGFGFNTVCGATLPETTIDSYQHLLDQYIARCDSKVEMKDSEMGNIRRAAAIALIKGAFAKTHREDLIIDMMQKKIDPKSYKVDVFLNDRFYNIVRDHKSML